MISYPRNWKESGCSINLTQIEERLIEIIKKLDCTNLSLSGGLDSSLILYFMVQVYGAKNIHCYTIACNEEHPDCVAAKKIVAHFGVDSSFFSPHCTRKIGDLPGDEIVRRFYECLQIHGVKDVIACDGIDEFMCGYYTHMKDPSEQTYYNHLRQLQNQHLDPLDRNSGKIKVLLPYLDNELIGLFSQIPISEKCDRNNRKKVILNLAKGKIPEAIINRRKYGFCDALHIKDDFAKGGALPSTEKT